MPIVMRDDLCRNNSRIRGHDVCCRSTEGVEGEMKSVLQSCIEDEGRPLGIGFQEQVSNQPELLR
jgi:hypothetical protein